MPGLCFCVADPSMPSDSDSGRPDEDTFGVSFLPNDVDETAAKDVAPGLNIELWCLLTQIYSKLLSICTKTLVEVYTVC